MAYHEQLKSDLKSMEEKLKSSFQEFKLEIKESFQEFKLEIKESFQGIQSAITATNQLLQSLQTQQLQRSALPSNASLLPHQTEPSASRSFRLDFKGELPKRLFTNNKLESCKGFSLTLELCDYTGERVCPGPWMKDLMIEYALIEGKFMVEERHDGWTVEDYNNHVAPPRGGKPPLLKGECKISLSEGFARVCELSITDNSRNGFRLGAQVIGGLPSGWIVRPAVSKAFRVLESRGEADQKYPAPSPADELYRLSNISKVGPIYDRAKQNKVTTVMDFLQLYYTDATAMKKILGIKGKRWAETVDHAKACILTDECYKYKYLDNTSGDALVLKCDFNIESVTFYGQTSQPYESLDKRQKQKVDELRKAAYKKRKDEKVVTKFYDSTNLVQARLEYPCSAKQQPAPLVPPASNMDPNVCGIKQQLAQPASNMDPNVCGIKQQLAQPTSNMDPNVCGIKQQLAQPASNMDPNVCTTEQQLGPPASNMDPNVCTIEQQLGPPASNMDPNMCSIKQQLEPPTSNMDPNVCSIEQQIALPTSIMDPDVCSVEQPAPLAPPAFNMDPNVLGAVHLPQPICNNPAEDYDWCQQYIMLQTNVSSFEQLGPPASNMDPNMCSIEQQLAPPASNMYPNVCSIEQQLALSASNMDPNVCSVEQPAPLALPAFNMDPNVLGAVHVPQPICNNPAEDYGMYNPAEDYGMHFRFYEGFSDCIGDMQFDNYSGFNYLAGLKQSTELSLDTSAYVLSPLPNAAAEFTRSRRWCIIIRFLVKLRRKKKEAIPERPQKKPRLSE